MIFYGYNRDNSTFVLNLTNKNQNKTMKKFALFMMVAGMLSLFACKSAPEQKTEGAKDTTATEQAADTAAVADTAKAM